MEQDEVYQLSLALDQIKDMEVDNIHNINNDNNNKSYIVLSLGGEDAPT
jgi:hypothetical protein